MATTTWMLSVKLVLISSAVLSTAAMIKLSAPIVQHFLVFDLPLIWSSFLSWLRPPYLYLVLNCIILTIVASSRLHPPKPVHKPPSPESDVPLPPAPFKDDAGGDRVRLLPSPMREKAFDLSKSPILFGYVDSVDKKFARKAKVLDETTEKENLRPRGFAAEEENGRSVGDEFVIHRSEWTPLTKRNGVEVWPESCDLNEKPLVSSRFGHRKPNRASPDGRGAALGVSKPRRNETLEATWRTITDGRPMPLTRHLKKMDTWVAAAAETVTGKGDSPFSSPVRASVKRSETFNDRRSGEDSDSSVLLSPSPGGSGDGGRGSGKLRRESSPSQDELNRRVEAFIRKFNEEMRLQRRQSFDHYREFVSPGSR